MKATNIALGPLGSKFFSLMQVRQQVIVQLGELQTPLGLTASQEQTLLKRLANNGLLLRLQRGVYLVPRELPAGGYWQPNEYYVVAKYMEFLKAKYYIGGQTAFHHYHFTTQIPNQVIVYNNKISRLQKIGKLYFHFIKIKTKHIDGLEKIILPNRQAVFMASNARTILDAIKDYQRYQTLPEAYQWLAEQSKNKKILNQFIELTLKHANISTTRRIGYILSQLGVSDIKLKPLHRKLTATKNWTPLVPNKNYKGEVNNYWRVINNVKWL